MWLLELICCLRTTEDDDDDAVKEEIADAAGDDNTVVVVGELISSSFFFSGLENSDTTHFLFIFTSILYDWIGFWYVHSTFPDNSGLSS